LQLAWDRPQRCSLVRIHWGESFASEYSIETSGDGKEWRTVKDVPQGHGGVEEFSFAPVTMRYLRMNGRHGTGGRATISAYSIREIEVYDMPGRSEDQ
jgi:hypothetical protein